MGRGPPIRRQRCSGGHHQALASTATMSSIAKAPGPKGCANGHPQIHPQTLVASSLRVHTQRRANECQSRTIYACKKLNVFRAFEWCCRCGLNTRPLPYQGSALPLSYGSNTGAPQPHPIGAAPRHGRGYAIGGLAQQDALVLPSLRFCPSCIPPAAHSHTLVRPPHGRDAAPKEQ
jgi:hypothetical protein